MKPELSAKIESTEEKIAKLQESINELEQKSNSRDDESDEKLLRIEEAVRNFRDASQGDLGGVLRESEELKVN